MFTTVSLSLMSEIMAAKSSYIRGTFGHVHHVTDEFPLPKEEFMWAVLNEYGIETWNHYSPMHFATSFRSRRLGKVGDCPVAETLFEQYVSLPIHPRLTNDAVAYMIESIRQLASRPHIAREIAAPLLRKLLALYDPELTLAPNPGHSHSLHGDQLAAAARPVSGAGGEEDCDSVVSAQWEVFSALVADACQSGGSDNGSGGHGTESGSGNESGDRKGTSSLFVSGLPVCVSRSPGRLDLMGGNDEYTGEAKHNITESRMRAENCFYCL
jgi:hypothetical protein